jgi:aryl-alcohol dehydrogenase-like predicted oxidoreductase
VLATKGRFRSDESPNGHGLSRRHLSLALDASPRRLNVETIDLYQLHGRDPLTRLEETPRFLNDAVRAGKITYAGLSDFTGWQLQKAVDMAELRGLSVPVSVQPRCNLLARAVEWEIVPACRAAGLGMLAWSPLASGWLTGKYRRGEPAPAGTRVVENADEGMRIWNQRGPVRADLAGARRGAQRGRRARRVPGSGGHRLADGPARRIVGDPRRPEHGPADRQPGRGWADADADA